MQQAFRDFEMPRQLCKSEDRETQSPKNCHSRFWRWLTFRLNSCRTAASGPVPPCLRLYCPSSKPSISRCIDCEVSGSSGAKFGGAQWVLRGRRLGACTGIGKLHELTIRCT